MRYKGEAAGTVTQRDDGTFAFRYDEGWALDPVRPPVSLTVPKRIAPYEGAHLFAFLTQLLPEGTNKRILCELHRIDPLDEFSILLRVATSDTVGAITVHPLSDA